MEIMTHADGSHHP